jgi:hypothetical protein
VNKTECTGGKDETKSVKVEVKKVIKAKVLVEDVLKNCDGDVLGKHY